jgi:hypothetical protein
MARMEPPSSFSGDNSDIFFIGVDSDGNWVAQDQRHSRGGLFVNRAQALRFVMKENGNRPQAVIMMPGVFELDLQGRTTCSASAAPRSDARDRGDTWMR